MPGAPDHVDHDAAPEAATSTRRWRPDDATGWALVAAAVAGLVLLVALLVRAATWDWSAVGDFGTLRLRTLDVGTADTPLVGIYSRWGWNHPGPLLFYLLAAPLRLAGGAGRGLLVGALLVNAAAVGAALWVAARAGRALLALAGLVLALLLVGLDPGGLLDPWNPFVLILPLFAAALAAWRSALGDRVAAVVLVVAGSLAVQAHIGVGPPVAVLVAVGGAGLVVRAVRGPEASHARRTLVLAGVVGLVCWLPPLVQQLTGSPGNLGEIVSFALDGSEPVNGWGDGARRVAQTLSLPPIWVTGDLSTAAGDHPVPWALLALVGAGAWAWRRRATSELVLCGTALALVAATLVACSRVAGVPFPYLFRWAWAVAAFVWFAVGAVVLHELRRHAWAERVDAAAAGLAGLVVLALVVAGPDLTDLRRSDQDLRAFEHLVEPTIELLDTVPGPTVVTITAYGIDGSMGIELLGRAEEEGIGLYYPDDVAFVFGEHRTIDPATARGELVLASGPAIARLAADPTFRLVGAHDPLTPDERAEYERLAAVDWDARSEGRSGPDHERFLELSEGWQSLAVYYREQPPG